MKELSLNILDIAQNSVTAKAKLIQIIITESDNELLIEIKDDGCGMEPNILANVTSPFSTSRKTRKVGLGLPLYKMQAELTGGWMTVESVSENCSSDHGTVVKANFLKTSVDFTPLGNIIDTLALLVMSSDQYPNNYELFFRHYLEGREITLDTRELKKVLGDDISISCPEIIAWIRDYLVDQYNAYD